MVYLLLTHDLSLFWTVSTSPIIFPKEGYCSVLLQTARRLRFHVLRCDLRTEAFSKAAKINSLISMALLYSKYDTCYFI